MSKNRENYASLKYRYFSLVGGYSRDDRQKLLKQFLQFVYDKNFKETDTVTNPNETYMRQKVLEGIPSMSIHMFNNYLQTMRKVHNLITSPEYIKANNVQLEGHLVRHATHPWVLYIDQRTGTPLIRLNYVNVKHLSEIEKLALHTILYQYEGAWYNFKRRFQAANNKKVIQEFERALNMMKQIQEPKDFLKPKFEYNGVDYIPTGIKVTRGNEILNLVRNERDEFFYAIVVDTDIVELLPTKETSDSMNTTI